MDWMTSYAPRVTKKLRRLLRTRPALVAGVVAFAVLTPAAATSLRSQSQPSAFRTRNVGPSTQGGPTTISKPTAVMAVRGKLKKSTVLSTPNELRLRKAHSAVFDTRKLQSTVVRRERAELAEPGQTAEETNPATSLPT